MIITDPTTLITGGDTGTVFAAPISLDFTNKIITITPGTGILPDAADGVTGQALYSALKILWRNNQNYIKYKFPMEAITPEQFDFINGWKLADDGDVTRKSLRTCGWAEKTEAGVITRKYMGVISLGTIDATDQPYYLWTFEGSEVQPKVNFTFPGPINEGIQIYGDALNGNLDYSDGNGNPDPSFQVFVRQQGKTYASSNNGAIGAPTLNYITYRFPLTNALDTNISSYATDAAISSAPTIQSATWTGGVLTVTTVAPHNFTAGVRVRITGADPAAYDGVYTVKSAGLTSTVFTADKATDPGTFVSGSLASIYAGITVEYGTNWKTNAAPYLVTFDVNEDATAENYTIEITDASGVATTKEIYEKIQWYLRQGVDINSNTGAPVVIGNTTKLLLNFVGSTLEGERGVFITGLNDQFLNSVKYLPADAATDADTVTYPFFATGVINFGSNAENGDFKFWMFYKDLDGVNDFGTDTAVIVQDKTAAEIKGTKSGDVYPWSFRYDTETAGGLRTAGTPAEVVVLGLGTSGGQWVSVDYTITRTQGQSILLAPAQERNYQNAA